MTPSNGGKIAWTVAVMIPTAIGAAWALEGASTVGEPGAVYCVLNNPAGADCRYKGQGSISKLLRREKEVVSEILTLEQAQEAAEAAGVAAAGARFTPEKAAEARRALEDWMKASPKRHIAPNALAYLLDKGVDLRGFMDARPYQEKAPIKHAKLKMLGINAAMEYLPTVGLQGRLEKAALEEHQGNFMDGAARRASHGLADAEDLRQAQQDPLMRAR